MSKLITLVLAVLAAVIALGVMLRWDMWLMIAVYWVCVTLRYVWEAVGL